MSTSRRLLRIATRKSPLALWQAQHVKERLFAHHPELVIELVGIQTRGDKILDSPLASVGGKGLFIKELEHSLREGHTDIAVHSMKDVTIDLPADLALPVILEREDPRDAFISEAYPALDSLPAHARIGTSSLRRQCQLRALGRSWVIQDLRGNIGTRLRRLDEGHFDAIVLAVAGLKRLGLRTRVRQFLDTDVMLPAIGQGAIGIECRADDRAVIDLIAPLYHDDTARCVLAERAVNRRLYGGCQLPIAGHASLQGGELHLRALVGQVDGSMILRGSMSGPAADGERLGLELAEDLLARGAAGVLVSVTDHR
ncbi:MAG: hydroxymethylbilane synthase [Chromatiales bacterium]